MTPPRRPNGLPRWLLLAAILGAVTLVACGSDEGAAVRRAVVAIQANINRGDAAAAYDRFGSSVCKTVPGRDAFIRNFDAAPYEIRNLVLLDDNIQINGDKAFLIISAEFRQTDGRTDHRTFFETMVKEAGRWKDEDCLQGGLGNILQAAPALPPPPAPSPTAPAGTPTPATPPPDSTAPAGTTTSATPSVGPDGA